MRQQLERDGSNVSELSHNNSFHAPYVSVDLESGKRELVCVLMGDSLAELPVHIPFLSLM
jgi:hypothetical protein